MRLVFQRTFQSTLRRANDDSAIEQALESEIFGSFNDTIPNSLWSTHPFRAITGALGAAIEGTLDWPAFGEFNDSAAIRSSIRISFQWSLELAINEFAFGRAIQSPLSSSTYKSPVGRGNRV
jgi:hypothetical protein